MSELPFLFFRPPTVTVFGLRPFEAAAFDLEQRLAGREGTGGNPVVAVLDGLPLENHVALAGRMVVDDPDEHRASYQPSQQQHGTAMASLVIHGDLHDDGPALQRSVYVRPIFLPDGFQGTCEITPPNRLLGPAQK